MKISTMLGSLTVVAAVTLGGLAYAATAPQGNPALGAELYVKCAPCHGLDGKGVAGKPVADLVAKMQAYQSGSFNAPKIEGMQKVLKPLSPQNLLDLASYITKM